MCHEHTYDMCKKLLRLFAFQEISEKNLVVCIACEGKTNQWKINAHVPYQAKVAASMTKEKYTLPHSIGQKI